MAIKDNIGVRQSTLIPGNSVGASANNRSKQGDRKPISEKERLKRKKKRKMQKQSKKKSRK
tara:strand:+ start:35 stop:217 length:183 start_codon:yes stop_codon:yes gene_type:complete